MTVQRLLVPIYFSEYADHAVAYAIGLASTLGARVILLHVIQSPPWGGVNMDVTLLMPTARFSSTWRQRGRTTCRPMCSASLRRAS